jgi:hypothetical protein
MSTCIDFPYRVLELGLATYGGSGDMTRNWRRVVGALALSVATAIGAVGVAPAAQAAVSYGCTLEYWPTYPATAVNARCSVSGGRAWFMLTASCGSERTVHDGPIFVSGSGYPLFVQCFDFATISNAYWTGGPIPG